MNQEGFAVDNLGTTASSTPVPLTFGGRGVMDAVGTFSTTPTVTLQRLGRDGTTWLTVAQLTTAGQVAFDYTSGQYRITTGGGATTIYASVSRVPYA